MERWREKWALVTGASAGLGEEFARQLAAAGAHLVLTARRKDRLDALADDLRRKNGVQVEVFAADLAMDGTVEAIFAFTEGRRLEMELLINNAGFGAYGEFHRIPLARQREMLRVNISAVVQLTHLYLPQMIARRRGDILIVASTAAFQAVPYISTYAATKAFDLIFAEGIAEEVRPYGVRVCALCPGSTHTEFRAVSGQPEKTFRMAESAEKVVRAGLLGLARGKTCVISGLHNKLMMESERLAPRRWVTVVSAAMFRPTD